MDSNSIIEESQHNIRLNYNNNINHNYTSKFFKYNDEEDTENNQNLANLYPNNNNATNKQ